MREAMFIKKNLAKWNSYQQEKSTGADETAERFSTLVDDLSYAKTYYPRSKVTRWINGMAAEIYQEIYRNKKEKLSRLFQFWQYDLPITFARHHRILLFAFLSFSLFVAIGVWASMHNEEFVSSVLGQGYVSMTEENIAKGDPFGVYKDDNPFSMFVRIAFNNIRVAFFTFIGGFSLGFFTLKIMWSNGIMLGCFQYLFFSHGLGLESILTIWIHGTIEIASIVLAGTAGFILADGIIFPGTYSRLESFKRGAKDAAKLLICLVPFFILASFFESYVTHLMGRTYDTDNNAGLPVWMAILILAGSLTLMVWYFVVWPLVLKKRGMLVQKDNIVQRLQHTHE